MIIKETYKLLNKHLPKVELEKRVSNILICPPLPTLEEPAISMQELVDTFKSTKKLVYKSSTDLSFSGDDHAFLVKDVGVLHYTGLYLDNFTTQQLYGIMLRISGYIQDNGYKLLSDKNIFRLIDDFTRDIRIYMSGISVDIYRYPDKVNEWTKRESKYEIDKYKDISTEPYTVDHEIVDQYEGRNIYATKDGMMGIVKDMVENLSYMNTQRKVGKELQIEMLSRLKIIRDHNRNMTRYNRLLKRREEHKPVSDTTGKLKDMVGDLYPTNLINQGVELREITLKIDMASRNADKLYESTLETKKRNEEAFKALLASFEHKKRNEDL